MRRSFSTRDAKNGALAALAMALAPSATAAQSHDSGRLMEQLVSFVVAEEHVRHLAGGLSNSEKAIDPDCAAVTPAELLAVELVTPVELDIRGRPISGTWHERWRVQACGGNAIRNALFEVDDDGRIAMFPLAPGTTRLSPSNQKSSVPLAIAMMSNRLDDCTDVRLINTRMPPPQDGEDNAAKDEDGGWREHWTFSACGETYRLTMSFSDAQDGLIGEPVDE